MWSTGSLLKAFSAKEQVLYIPSGTQLGPRDFIWSIEYCSKWSNLISLKSVSQALQSTDSVFRTWDHYNIYRDTVSPCWWQLFWLFSGRVFDFNNRASLLLMDQIIDFFYSCEHLSFCFELLTVILLRRFLLYRGREG